MKKITILLIAVITVFLAYGQDREQRTKIYDPMVNARQEIKEAVSAAKKDGKHVLIMVGGNW
jgi:hypothetical protein